MAVVYLLNRYFYQYKDPSITLKLKEPQVMTYEDMARKGLASFNRWIDKKINAKTYLKLSAAYVKSEGNDPVYSLVVQDLKEQKSIDIIDMRLNTRIYKEGLKLESIKFSRRPPEKKRKKND
jgi:hypothetical protein